jgi:hypothetical protein
MKSLNSIRRREDISTAVNKDIRNQIIQNLSQACRLAHWNLRKIIGVSQIVMREKTKPKGSLLLRQN